MKVFLRPTVRSSWALTPKSTGKQKVHVNHYRFRLLSGTDSILSSTSEPKSNLEGVSCWPDASTSKTSKRFREHSDSARLVDRFLGFFFVDTFFNTSRVKNHKCEKLNSVMKKNALIKMKRSENKRNWTLRLPNCFSGNIPALTYHYMTALQDFQAVYNNDT